MIYDIQKASLTKRISAYLLDLIAFSIVVTALACLISKVTNYDNAYAKLETLEAEYAEKYNVDFNITDEEYSALPEEEQEKYDEADTALRADARVQDAITETAWLSALILSLSILGSFLILEIAIPLWLKNGQSIGKKVFGLAVMHTNGLRITGFGLFVRGILGKCVLETMIPVALAIFFYFGYYRLIIIAFFVLLLLIQSLCYYSMDERRVLHDRLSSTVEVDFKSQLIFDTAEQREAYIAAHKNTETKGV